MGKIVTEEECKKIKALNKQFEPFADKGWMCEGGERNGVVCNAIFNNDTDEIFWADYNGNIIDAFVEKESAENLKAMAKIQGDIRKING
jgi:hypothetical protein